MPKKSKEIIEYLKPGEFRKKYPVRARVLEDDVLSGYVSWALVDRSAVASGKTYLLMTSSAYKKACYRFAPMTEDFAYNARNEIQAPLRERDIEIEDCRSKIFSLEVDLKDFHDRQTAFNEDQNLLKQEMGAVRILKTELQRLIEHLNIGDSPVYPELRGFFARVDDLPFNKFTRQAWGRPHRRPKLPPPIVAS